MFDYQPGDVYACVADIGWITGHSYVVYGPLCNGATTVLFETHPTYPDPGLTYDFSISIVKVLGLHRNTYAGLPVYLELHAVFTYY